MVKTNKISHKRAHSKKRTVKKIQKEREQRWLTNFQIVCSRDNEVIPKYQRELFDKPLRYDVSGHRIPVECNFLPKSPVVMSPHSTALKNRNKSIWGTLIEKADNKTCSDAIQTKISSMLRRIQVPDSKEAFLFFLKVCNSWNMCIYQI